MSISAPVGTGDISCDDFLAFQQVLRDSREVDDKIIYALNSSIPTKSFASAVDASQECRSLYNKLLESYNDRERAIRRCTSVCATNIDALRQKRDMDPDDTNISKELRREQYKLRMYNAERNVEEVIRARSLQSWNERCRLHCKMS